ncbi:MAG: mannosyltransferase [Solirubrobacteraceae bacterium]|nr:mannosyltransferase [Solirubrobacteraceae bacterium]
MLALTLLAAALRFATLDQQSLWLDESYAIEDIARPFGAMLEWVRAKEGSPPLYFVLAWGWAKLFGAGDVGLRSLSALAGTATVPLVYAAGAAVASRRAGVVAAALTAVSPLMVWYSQDARPYALLVAFAAASLWCAARAASGGKPRWLAGWAATASLALTTHYFAGFLVAGELAWLVMRLRRRSLAPAAVVCAVQLALIPLALGGARHVGTQWIAHLPLSLRLGQVPDQFLFGPGEAAVAHRAAAVVALVVLGAAVFLIVRRSDAQGRRAAAVCGLLAGVCLLGPLAFTLAGADYLDARNLMVAWVPLALVVGIAATAERSPRAGAVLAAGLLALFAAGTAALDTRPDLQRQDWRDVARALGSSTGPRALIVPAPGRTLLDYLPGLRWDVARHQRVREVDLIGSHTDAARGLACWWGGACGLPRQLIPAAQPFRGFRRIASRRVGPFIVERFVASSPHRVSLHRSTAYRVHHHYAVFFALQPG